MPRLIEAVHVPINYVVTHYPMTTVAAHATVISFHHGHSVLKGHWHLDAIMAFYVTLDCCLFYSEFKEMIKHERHLWRDKCTTPTNTTEKTPDDQCCSQPLQPSCLPSL